MKKRLLSTLLALCVVLALLPVTALAADTDFIIEDGILLQYTGSGGAVTIPDGVTEIGDMAFAYCGSLTSITIPSGVTAIGGWAFLDSGLTSVIIPDGVTTIGVGTFASCESLTSVTIATSVTLINYAAFLDCNKLKDVYYGGSKSQWDQISIDMEENEPLLNATIHYNGAPSTPAPSVPFIGAVLSPQNLAVDGKNVDCEKYNIDGRNYFKLRDLAKLLSGTGSQFEVGYDEATATVSITSGQPYTPNGTELTPGVDNSGSAMPSGQAITINGEKHDELTVYNIGGSNFFQLRELGSILGFEVDFDGDTNTAIVRSAAIAG